MNNNRKIISWLLLVSWMGFIFFMSQQPGNVSHGQSDFIINLFKSIGIPLNEYFGDVATFIVRKCGHFSEYFLLFLFSYNVSKLYYSKGRAKLYAIIFVFLYACTDEIHQSFIPGRGPGFRDVLIDTFGGTVGLIITKILEMIKAKNIKHN